jgi:transposase
VWQDSPIRYVERETLVELYVNRGLNLREVAAQLDLSTGAIRQKMLAYGIPTGRRGNRLGDIDRYTRPEQLLTRRFLVEHYLRRRMSVVDIAKQTGFSHETVRRFLDGYGIPIRQGRQSVHHLTRRQLADLRQRGYTLPQIAEHLGCSKSTVERALKRYGLPRR